MNLLLRPILAIHRFLSDAPAGLDAERRDQYAFTNWCMVLALSTHLAYVLIFASLDLRVLTLFNIGSVGLFGACLALAKRGWSNSAMLLACIEVFVHAILATLYLGYVSGFHYHMVLVVVVTFLFTGVPLWVRLGSVVGVGLAYVALATATIRAQPWIVLSPTLTDALAALNVAVFLTTVSGICWYYTFAVQDARAALRREFQRSERLLHNILPATIANRLKDDADTQTIADRFECCTVLFADIAGFTAWSASLSPEELVRRLNEIFSAFDALAARHGLEKIKTIGDAYMVAAGIPEPRPDHADAMARMALDMQAFVRSLRDRSGVGLAIRVGIHSGPAVAGVIGLRKFIYDLWGDTVNTAARMESHGLTDEIQVSDATARLLGASFQLTDRGVQQIKGKGEMRTWLLTGARPVNPAP